MSHRALLAEEGDRLLVEREVITCAGCRMRQCACDCFDRSVQQERCQLATAALEEWAFAAQALSWCSTGLTSDP